MGLRLSGGLAPQPLSRVLRAVCPCSCGRVHSLVKPTTQLLPAGSSGGLEGGGSFARWVPLFLSLSRVCSRGWRSFLPGPSHPPRLRRGV